MHGKLEWALVADGQHARILERRLPGGAWRECPEEERHLDNPRTHEQGTDRPGRAFASTGGSRSAMEPRQDLHEATKERFAASLAERLDAAAAERRFASLVLVAPPSFLGYLRRELGDEARRCLRGSLDKDLAQATLAEITPHLAEARPAHE